LGRIREDDACRLDTEEGAMVPDDGSLLDEATQATSEAEAANVPGVYVYSFPTVLADEQDGLVRLKVGRAGSGATDRVFGQQSAVTGWPEPPLLLRVYWHDVVTPAEMEIRLHDALDAVGHNRVDGRRVGREWFWTSLDAIDALARLAGWTVRFQNRPAEEQAEEVVESRSHAARQAWETMRATGAVPGQRKVSERGREAYARKRKMGGRRGPGQELTDDELRDYIEKVLRDQRDPHVIDEQEYAYWIEGFAFSGRRFRRLWNDVVTSAPEEAAVADGHIDADQF
jgi:hypothetical protein